MESCCHRFAGAFLIPQDQFKEAFGGARSRICLGEVIAIKEEWGMSISAVMRRAKDLALITDAHYLHFVIATKKQGWGTSLPEPGKWNGTEEAFRLSP